MFIQFKSVVFATFGQNKKRFTVQYSGGVSKNRPAPVPAAAGLSVCRGSTSCRYHCYLSFQHDSIFFSPCGDPIWKQRALKEEKELLPRAFGREAGEYYDVRLVMREENKRKGEREGVGAAKKGKICQTLQRKEEGGGGRESGKKGAVESSPDKKGGNKNPARGCCFLFLFLSHKPRPTKIHCIALLLGDPNFAFPLHSLVLSPGRKVGGSCV